MGEQRAILTATAITASEEPIEGMLDGIRHVVDAHAEVELVEAYRLTDLEDGHGIRFVLECDSPVIAYYLSDCASAWRLSYGAECVQLEVDGGSPCRESMTAGCVRARDGHAYHAAARTARGSIVMHGLVPDPGELSPRFRRRYGLQEAGVFVASHHRSAQTWADDHGGVATDVWEIDVRGLSAEVDKLASEAYVVRDEIAPERVRRLSETERALIVATEQGLTTLRGIVSRARGVEQRLTEHPQFLERFAEEIETIRSTEEEVSALERRLHLAIEMHHLGLPEEELEELLEPIRGAVARLDEIHEEQMPLTARIAAASPTPYATPAFDDAVTGLRRLMYDLEQQVAVQA